MAQEYDAEYDVVLDTEPTVDVLQYPLSSSVPSISEIRTKESGKYMEVVLEQKDPVKKQRKMKGCASDTINDYYVLHIKGHNITGKRVRNIVQLRPVLEDKPETLSKKDKKESVRIYALNETQEEMEIRVKNPNYMVNRIEKEKWNIHAVQKHKTSDTTTGYESEYGTSHGVYNDGANIMYGSTSNGGYNSYTGHNADANRVYSSNYTCPSQNSPGATVSKHTSDVTRVVYNARVVNKKVVQQILPDVHISVIMQVLSEMTDEVAGRYVLRSEYYNDMRDIHRKIVDRMKEGNGCMELTYEELADPNEQFMYVLEQVAYREKHMYIMKGHNEKEGTHLVEQQ